MSQQIDGIRLFLFRTGPRSARRPARNRFFLRLRCGSVCGWSEFAAPPGQRETDIITYTKCFGLLRGKNVSDGFAIARAMVGIWPNPLSESAEMALLDLWGKLTGKSAAQLLVLDGRMPVHGVVQLQERDPDVLAERVRVLAEKGKLPCIKLALSGDIDTDRELVAAVRRYAPQKGTYLIGAPHERYTSRLYSTAEQIGMQLLKLYAAGLDACEDPARLTVSEWILLQQYIGDLSLIAESPLRFARRTIHTVNPDMAKVYNIRPGYTGSVFDAVLLAERIVSGGGHVMVGDDDFIGPACEQWQQIAIALGADWVEAAYKPGISDFYRSVQRGNGILLLNGVYNQLPVAGFGTELDEGRLGSRAACVFDL